MAAFFIDHTKFLQLQGGEIMPTTRPAFYTNVIW